MEITKILQRINFSDKYAFICMNHNDFDNRMRDSNKKTQCDVLDKLNIKYEYFSNGSFFKISDKINDYEISLHLVLKNGLVEPLLYISFKNIDCFPDGRFDFIPGKMNVPFNREKFNLPKYKDPLELEQILQSIIHIINDIKQELLKL